MSGSADPVPDETRLRAEAFELAARMRPFADLLRRNGVPPAWRREASYATLVRLVLEQQVSLASARAAFGRLEARVGMVTPGAILASSDDELRRDGFSRQKAGYVRGIGLAIVDGALDPAALRPGEEASTRLRSLPGVGPWTAACFRLFAMGEPDVWPVGDRALHVSMASVLALAAVPGSEEAARIADGWSPYRSMAARMLWHDYLGGRSHIEAPGAGFL